MKMDGRDQRRRSHRRSVSPAGVGSSVAVGRQGSRTRQAGPRPRGATPVAGDDRSWTRDPTGAPSVADSVRDQFPFNSNQLCVAAVSTWTTGASYYGPVGVNAHRGTRAMLPSVRRFLRRICDRCDTKLHEN